MNQKLLFEDDTKELTSILIAGGNVPGGHNVIYDGKRKPFITNMKECNSIALRHSDVVVDIGAYVGTYAIRCARYPVKEVIAYEPTPFTFNILSKTKCINLKCENAAIVGDDRKCVDLHISKGIGVTNSIVLSKCKKESVKVRAVNYVEAVKNATIVKIDVEGAEYDYPIIQENLRAIIIDFHKVTGIDWLKKAKKIISDLKDAGYITVIESNFSCGWTQAGSWIKDMQTSGECEELMQGKFCCGCGVELKSIGKKALCSICYTLWNKKHREDFALTLTSYGPARIEI